MFKLNFEGIIGQMKIIITDKDCKDILALEGAFPDAVYLLCLFHVLQIINRKIMGSREAERISDAFRTAVFT